MKVNRPDNLCILCCGLVLGAAISSGAWAQGLQNRVITLIYPFTPGGAGDLHSRAVAAEMSKTLGQQIIVENRVGAGGRVAANALINAKPDGQFLAVANTSVLYQGLMSSTFKIEPVKDYAPVAQWSSSNYAMYAGGEVPFRDIKGLIAYAKANPRKLNWGTTGVGSSGHLGLEVFQTTAAVTMTHIPYASGPAYLQGALRGDIHVFLSALNPERQYVETGKLVVLGTTGEQRSLYLDSPTMKEQGLDWVYETYSGLLAPPGTPTDILGRLSAAVSAAMKTPELIKLTQERLGGTAISDSSPEKFTAMLRADLKRMGAAIQRAGIRID